jgi:hypothetical protein
MVTRMRIGGLVPGMQVSVHGIKGFGQFSRVQESSLLSVPSIAPDP